MFGILLSILSLTKSVDKSGAFSRLIRNGLMKLQWKNYDYFI